MKNPPTNPEAPKKSVHLVCNAHMDPVWLWEWEEGAAEAVATFRTAADLCDEFGEFIFNHNEAILYKWVEEYEPALFRRIQKLVREGRWHIMGGWHLQPDCNMPAGESFVRQILAGRRYFQDRFGVQPSTAINFDPFGHSRGLVQLLAKSGYTSYLFCRPAPGDCELPAELFTWRGFDGSEITAARVSSHYNSPLGKVREKIARCLGNAEADNPRLILWGVGNHGGGPSRKDLRDIRKLIDEAHDRRFMHSTPESYFTEAQGTHGTLPVHANDINPWAVGCYTSQIRIKQSVRQLEGLYFMVEKMACTVAVNDLLPYPAKELRAALEDLLLCHFHDILPGSSIQPVEEMSLRILDHGREELTRLKARLFFALTTGEARAAAEEIPILVYNPHPVAVTQLVECEFQMADQNWKDTHTQVTVLRDGQPLAAQVEQELSNIALDWRKRVVFRTTLAPGRMNRFDCRLELRQRKPRPTLIPRNGRLHVVTDDLQVDINTRTGLLDRFDARGYRLVAPGALRPLVLRDNADPWGMRTRRFARKAGQAHLMAAAEGTRFSGLDTDPIPSVRVIEEGAARIVVEAVLAYERSAVRLRYLIPRTGTEMEVDVLVQWAEKDRMLKLEIPLAAPCTNYRGQTAYGVQALPLNGDEAVSQKWCAAVNEEQDWMLTCINDGIYGSDATPQRLRLTLLRSPAYSAHPIGKRDLVPRDRFTPRSDQGERRYRFWLNAGSAAERTAKVELEAQVKHEPPVALSFFPNGEGSPPQPMLRLDNPAVQVAACKQAEDGHGWTIRLFETTGQPAHTNLYLPWANVEARIEVGAWEVKTLRFAPDTGTLDEVDLMEQATPNTTMPRSK